MQDQPSASELVEAVREFLEKDVFPAVEGRTQYHTRVAMNVLAIVRRELEQSAEADVRERDGLDALLGSSDAESTLFDLNQRLAAGIREGTLGASRADLVVHLRDTLRDKLAIANPRYLED